MIVLGPLQRRIVVTDESQVGQARRAATQLATEAHFPEAQAGRAAIVASELATNLLRHTKGGGELLMQVLRIGDVAVLELLSIDRGPGMVDVERCLRDGYSTAGTAGNGLGAIRRLSDTFDVYSEPATGTVLMARIRAITELYPQPGAPLDRGPTFGAVSQPIQGETVCGDGWGLQLRGQQFTATVIDGLGHGPLAALASQAALRCLTQAPETQQDPAQLLSSADEALRGTRGGAMAVAATQDTGGLRYAGIGNIAGTLATGETTRGLMSHNGIVGAQMRKPQALDFPWTPATLLVMHSDGLQSRWQISKYPGLIRRHPALIAAVLYRDHTRGRDDVTVLVVSPGGHA